MSKPVEERLSAARVLSHLGVMGLVAAVMGLIVAGLAIPFAGALGLGAQNLSEQVKKLPEELKTEDLAQRTQMLDADGNVIATLYDENRVNVPLAGGVSRSMVKAIVAIEDYRFYEHGALDLKGTLRALITNKASGSQVQGGSSITQQMVKLTLLAQAETRDEKTAATDDTYARKIRELRYAIAIEEQQSKDWILERYLNIAYFGDGAYGVQAAAQHYFSEDANKLDLQQSATLAGLVKNPTGYDPTNAPERALERRNIVLDRMAQLNVIDQEQADRIKQRELDLVPNETTNGCVNSAAPFFCDYARNYLMEDPALGATRKERKEKLLSGGLTIHTTIDQRFQKAADASVRSHVNPTDQAIGGLAMVEPGTGEVRALAQSRPMGANRKLGQTYLNYVVPKQYGDSNGFQPGSTFKAFVLATALKQGVPLSTPISAPEPISVIQTEYSDCRNRPYGNIEAWEPENSTTSDPGPYDLYQGTRLSINTFFAQLELKTGLCEPYKLAKRLGIRLDNPKGDPKTGEGAERTPAFTLGVGDTSPLEMAEAYATFAARGLHCKASPVTAIEDVNGEPLGDFSPDCTQVLEEPVADGVNSVLRGVQEPGGFGYTFDLELSMPSAGKTGTTSSQKAVWFVGYTPQLATASMIAGANSLGAPVTLQYQTVGGSYIAEATGSQVAGPVWRDAMRVIQQWLTSEDFVSPDMSSIETAYATVPSVSGMSIATATSTLHAAGFKVAVGPAVASGSAAGTVATSFPAGGSNSVAGMPVLLSPSTGQAPPKKGGGGNGNGNGNGNGGRGGGDD